MNPAPYLPNTVERNAVFVFDCGEPVLPDGWCYRTRVLDEALRIDTRSQAALFSRTT